jgi:hypothetical protein
MLELLHLVHRCGRTILLAGSSRFDTREYGMQPPRILTLGVEPEVEVGVELIALRNDDV